MRKKKSPADVVLFHNHCVVLGIDPGKKAGAAVTYDDRLLMSQAVRDKPLERARVVATAFGCAKTIADAIGEEVHGVLVVERFGAGAGAFGRFGARTRDGIAARAGAWMEAWELGGGKKKHIVRVFPQTWRSPVLGRGQGSAVLMKELAKIYVVGRYGLCIEDDNEAEAICIATWAASAFEVGLVVGTRTHTIVGEP